MKNIWEEFKQKYDNEQTLREAFTTLCVELLERHFPGKEIDAVNKSLSSNLADKSKVIHFSRFYLDELSNSRKGQIRKSFSDTLINYENNQNKIFAWALCVPLIFNEEEQIWFYNWREKMIEQYQINILLFDGEFIVETLKKYDLFEKWFADETITENENINEIENISDNNFDNQNDIVESEENNIAEDENLEEDKNLDILIENQLIENHEESEHLIENNNEQEQTIENKNEESTENNEINHTINQEFIDEGKKLNSIFNKLKQHHNKIHETHADLSGNQQIEFDNIFKKNKLTAQRFSFESVEIDNYSTADLVYKARHYRVNENYEKSLFIYEKILERNDFKVENVEEIAAGKELCEQVILYRNYITEGDFYFAKNDKINALTTYEKAFKIDNKRKEIIKKYYFTYAEALVEQGIYGLALEKYDAALVAEPNSKEIKQRREFARLMFLATKVFQKKPAAFLNPIIAPYYFYKARKYDKNNTNLSAKLKTVKKNLSLFFLTFAAVFLTIYLLAQIPTSAPKQETEKLVYKNSKKVLTMYDFQMKKGDFYRQNYSEQKPHYLDSAIVAYKNAIRYNPQDSLAAAYFAEVRQKKSDYITRAQELIRSDSAAYFISMRNPSEGLRLFKYMFTPYDKSTGKFGYVDENMNIIVPPIFDFNHNKMLDAGESFKNGKALVCLEVSPGDTVYFYIDKFCNRVRN